MTMNADMKLVRDQHVSTDWYWLILRRGSSSFLALFLFRKPFRRLILAPRVRIVSSGSDTEQYIAALFSLHDEGIVLLFIASIELEECQKSLRPQQKSSFLENEMEWEMIYSSSHQQVVVTSKSGFSMDAAYDYAIADYRNHHFWPSISAIH